MYYMPQMNGTYDEISVTDTNWTTSINKGVKSIAVIGHCDWEISWQVTSLFSLYWIVRIRKMLFLFISVDTIGSIQSIPKSLIKNTGRIMGRIKNFGSIRNGWQALRPEKHTWPTQILDYPDNIWERSVVYKHHLKEQILTSLWHILTSLSHAFQICFKHVSR